MAEFSGLQHAAPEQEEERRQHQRAAAKVASILAVSAAVGIAAFATVGVITEFATKQKKEKLLETMSHATQEQALHMENRIESSEQALFAFRQYRTKDSASDAPQIFRQIVQ